MGRSRNKSAHEYTDFEEIQGESAPAPERQVRTEPWSLDDFVPVFNKLGLLQDGEEYVSVETVRTGLVVVNGKESVQRQELRISFTFDPDFTAEMDGSMLAGIWAKVTVGGNLLLYELIYCVPDDMETWYAIYHRGQ
jgi:hypothetical protein